MEFDVKQYLMTDMGFDEATATEMAAKFKPEQVERVTARTAKLTAEEKRIAETQRQLAEANDKLNREMAEWATLSAEDKRQAEDLRAQLEESQRAAFALQQKLTRVATDAGIDPKTVLEGTTVVEPKKPEPPAVDLSKYVARDQIAPVVQFQMELAAAIPHIVEQHRELFGKPLDPRSIVKEIQARAQKGENVDPVAVWEEMHKVADRRAALAEETRTKELAAAEARGYEKARTESALPTVQQPGRHAPVFMRPGDNGAVARTSVLNRPRPQSTALSAAQAFRSGKYRSATGR